MSYEYAALRHCGSAAFSISHIRGNLSIILYIIIIYYNI